MDESTPKHPNRKQSKKLRDGHCYFCKETNYAILDAHRIIPGSEGGKYTESNMITTCASCHRRIHAKEIIVDRKYNSTKGVVLHYWKNGEEHWD
jgi:5-methylcytosine-specific restriction endonuclease McrA